MAKTDTPKMAKARTSRASPKPPLDMRAHAGDGDSAHREATGADPFEPDAPAAPPAVSKSALTITGITPIGDSSFSLHFSNGDRIECICAGNGGLEANREARARLLASALFPVIERKESP